jgi:hypothetical protein
MSSLENKELTNPEKINDWPSQKNSSAMRRSGTQATFFYE